MSRVTIVNLSTKFGNFKLRFGIFGFLAWILFQNRDYIAKTCTYSHPTRMSQAYFSNFFIETQTFFQLPLSETDDEIVISEKLSIKTFLSASVVFS